MELTTSWTQLSTTGAVVQKHGQTPVLLVYKATTPDNSEDRFTVSHPDPLVFPDLSSVPLWGRSVTGTAQVTVAELG